MTEQRLSHLLGQLERQKTRTERARQAYRQARSRKAIHGLMASLHYADEADRLEELALEYEGAVMEWQAEQIAMERSATG